MCIITCLSIVQTLVKLQPLDLVLGVTRRRPERSVPNPSHRVQFGNTAPTNQRVCWRSNELQAADLTTLTPSRGLHACEGLLLGSSSAAAADFSNTSHCSEHRPEICRTCCRLAVTFALSSTFSCSSCATIQRREQVDNREQTDIIMKQTLCNCSVKDLFSFAFREMACWRIMTVGAGLAFRGLSSKWD